MFTSYCFYDTTMYPWNIYTSIARVRMYVYMYFFYFGACSITSVILRAIIYIHFNNFVFMFVLCLFLSFLPSCCYCSKSIDSTNSLYIYLCLVISSYVLLFGKGNENHQLGTGFFVHRRIVSALKRVEFVSDRLSYIVLGGRWHNTIIVNVHAPSEEKSDTSKEFLCGIRAGVRSPA